MAERNARTQVQYPVAFKNGLPQDRDRGTRFRSYWVMYSLLVTHACMQ